ncbi:oxidoreductase [Oceanobacillus kimchii]|uniref:oxidoreductase n=1 Tax=Oceanobacillus TaxID=182709 RepID=UPI0003475D84|nr:MULTISPECIES: oxidoreductase [Oceanobacillus]MCT1576945.1 oxidoreductase [Oceanobacillus kimchii]MCT2135015.1 oxidoreductase [Oceanobacillus kimchii]OEH56298.1 2-dehydropantoate 2-reductase [Oceanobacillus sp. E9]
MKNFGVIGPGAVGSVIAEILLENGQRVHLLGRNAGEVRIEREGQLSEGTLSVEELSSFQTTLDYIFIAVKGTQLSNVLPIVEKLSHENTVTIICQNGYGQLERINMPHTYQAVVYISGQKKDQTITHFRDRKLILPENKDTIALHQFIGESDLVIQISPNYLNDMWFKLIVNLGINSVTALSRNTARILTNEKVRNLCESLIEEGIKIANAEGIHFENSTIKDIMDIYDGYPPNMGTSMYYDVLNGNPMEIDYIQGFLYRKSQEHGLNTPHIDTVYSLLVASELG